jgi:hypothetical protein
MKACFPAGTSSLQSPDAFITSAHMSHASQTQAADVPKHTHSLCCGTHREVGPELSVQDGWQVLPGACCCILAIDAMAIEHTEQVGAWQTAHASDLDVELILVLLLQGSKANVLHTCCSGVDMRDVVVVCWDGCLQREEALTTAALLSGWTLAPDLWRCCPICSRFTAATVLFLGFQCLA